MTDRPSPSEQVWRDQLKLRSAADLIERIESTGYTAEPGPLVNRLEWMEIKRRLSHGEDGKVTKET